MRCISLLCSVFLLAGQPAPAEDAGEGPAPVIVQRQAPELLELDFGQPTDGRSEFLSTMLAAISARDQDAILALLNSPSCEAQKCEWALREQPLVHLAVRLADTATIATLVGAGADINHKDPVTGLTPLMEALRRADRPMVEFLINLGADPGIATKDGLQAGTLAQLVGLDDLVAPPPLRLKQEEADMLLLRAIEAGSVEAMVAALDAGARVNAVAPNGWSALMIAAFQGQGEAVHLLLRRGANRAYTDPEAGYNVAHAALIGNAATERHGMLKTVIDALIDGGNSDVTQQGENVRLSDLFMFESRKGITAMQIAENQKILEILEEMAGPEINEGYIDLPGEGDGNANGDTLDLSTNDTTDEGGAEAAANEMMPAIQSSKDVILDTPGVVIIKARGGRVDTENLNLRTKPATDGNIIGTLPYGTSLTIVGHSADLGWVAVLCCGSPPTAGWVRYGYVSLTD